MAWVRQYSFRLLSTCNVKKVLPEVTRIPPLGVAFILCGLEILNPMGASAGSARFSERFCGGLRSVRLRCQLICHLIATHTSVCSHFEDLDTIGLSKKSLSRLKEQVFVLVFPETLGMMNGLLK